MYFESIRLSLAQFLSNALLHWKHFMAFTLTIASEKTKKIKKNFKITSIMVKCSSATEIFYLMKSLVFSLVPALEFYYHLFLFICSCLIAAWLSHLFTFHTKNKTLSTKNWQLEAANQCTVINFWLSYWCEGWKARFFY